MTRVRQDQAPADAVVRPLGAWAIAARVVHGTITAFFVTCLYRLWRAAITGKRRREGWIAAALVSAEGAIVYANGGTCPMGPLHHRLGDDKAFFELIMPQRMARHAVPALGAFAAAGMAILAAREIRARSGV